MESVDWIFNCTREPHPRKDLVKRYPESNHCIILRNGHLFQVPLTDGKAPVTWEHLEDAFDGIIHTSNDSVDTFAPLTAGDQDAWAKNREQLRSSSTHNNHSLEIIESSAFNICLDGDAPAGATERLNHFLLGITNRWSDKTLQFIVRANGASAILAEHTHIDGGILRQLNEHLYRRLTESTGNPALTTGHESTNDYATTNRPEFSNGHAKKNGHTTTNGDPKKAGPLFNRLEFDSIPNLLIEARHIQRDFTRMTAPLTSEIGICAFPSLSANVFRDYGCAPRAACQVAIQLAARIYFGEQIPSWETVSLRAFPRGRVDIVQTVLPSMYRFCSAAL
ncbi:hypothetical protein SLS60_011586 [Paraconiothyrium brasiliense]|uniref:Choline/carnitine acyltransferase domain-containing protein n=1 Tax=Paraconiothyrium brasiliense TaxID=300254 RepID=A0ABR3QIK6_9PLEO